eukprot:1124269-Prorocentrum_minimum.AAC.1
MVQALEGMLDDVMWECSERNERPFGSSGSAGGHPSAPLVPSHLWPQFADLEGGAGGVGRALPTGHPGQVIIMPHEWQPLIGPMFFTRPTDLVEPRMRLSHPITSARHLLYHCLYQSTANLEKALWQSEAAYAPRWKGTSASHTRLFEGAILFRRREWLRALTATHREDINRHREDINRHREPHTLCPLP